MRHLVYIALGFLIANMLVVVFYAAWALAFDWPRPSGAGSVAFVYVTTALGAFGGLAGYELAEARDDA